METSVSFHHSDPLRFCSRTDLCQRKTLESSWECRTCCCAPTDVCQRCRAKQIHSPIRTKGFSRLAVKWLQDLWLKRWTAVGGSLRKLFLDFRTCYIKQKDSSLTTTLFSNSHMLQSQQCLRVSQQELHKSKIHLLNTVLANCSALYHARMYSCFDRGFN